MMATKTKDNADGHKLVLMLLCCRWVSWCWCCRWLRSGRWKARLQAPDLRDRITDYCLVNATHIWQQQRRSRNARNNFLHSSLFHDSMLIQHVWRAITSKESAVWIFNFQMFFGLKMNAVQCCNGRPECLILMMVFSVLMLNFLMMSNLALEGISVFWVLLLTWLIVGCRCFFYVLFVCCLVFLESMVSWN